MSQSQKVTELNGSEIAIIGMSCRFPGADTPEQFWDYLSRGIEPLTYVTAEDLKEEGIDPSLLENPYYVPIVPAIKNIEYFDANFFGYTALEAKIMDPQQRAFLECAWETFEHAGYVSEDYPGKIGVFGGAKTNTYLIKLYENQEFFRSLDHFQIALGNDLGCLVTRVAYKLNLRGPSYAIHTACSTSLVAVHLACQSLLLHECDMALAGGAAINVPQRRGYLYQKGGILSPDGRCRTFDADSSGSNFGNGVGIVLLKRLTNAISDRDQIYAIIRGSASNNDGAEKASYTAPGVEGQTDVLLEAVACAGIQADTISYIEAHGTATELGDAIEMLALNEAFNTVDGDKSKRRRSCAIGSVKTNIGHLETAAGVAGLIKTALALHHRQIPPSLNFERPNPKINFDDGPFYVNTQLRDWKSTDTPRRAGVSSFGIGSANAHVILEEAPWQSTTSSSRPWQLLLLSARSESALQSTTDNLIQFTKERPSFSGNYLADLAYTLKVGRKGFQYRRAAVCSNDSTVAISRVVEEALGNNTALTHNKEISNRPIIFLFPGLGDHYPLMSFSLYKEESAFKHWIDKGAEVLQSFLHFDIREVLYTHNTEVSDENGSKKRSRDFRLMVGRSSQNADSSVSNLNQTLFIQPVTFVIEYALAKLWIEWGIKPQGMVGYSLGEYVAACLAGVFSFEDALMLVAERARMIQDLTPGAMLAVPLPESEIKSQLEDRDLSLAAVNGPSLCVLSGSIEAIKAAEQYYSEGNVLTYRLPTSHAFHSKMMDEVSNPLIEIVKKIELHQPQIPYISNYSGTWMRNEDALDPVYWAKHLRGTVRFNESLQELIRQKNQIFLEVGPGQSMTSMVKQHPDYAESEGIEAFASMPGAYDTRSEQAFLLETLAKLWLVGQTPDWAAYYKEEARRRIPLPTYPFERQRYWVDSLKKESTITQPRITLEKKQNISEWFYQPDWILSTEINRLPEMQPCRLIFEDNLGLGTGIVNQLKQLGQNPILVKPGEKFSKLGEREFIINPNKFDDYVKLLSVAGDKLENGSIVHLWSISRVEDSESESEYFRQRKVLGFDSLLFLAQALGRRALSGSIHIEVITDGLHKIIGDEIVYPEKGLVIGPSRVIPQEFSKITCRCIDISSPNTDTVLQTSITDLISEFAIEHDDKLIAYRSGQRYIQTFTPIRIEETDVSIERLRDQGVYLITGGVGGLGLVLAEHLAKKIRAKLILVSRTGLPDRAKWPELLEGSEDAQIVNRIKAVMRMEELGAEIYVAAANVEDESQMRSVIEVAEERFGNVNGIIHLAGIPGGGIIQLKTREAAEQIISPKVNGALILGKLFANHHLDFLVLYSSIASVLGEFGQVDYCAANAFLDFFVEHNKIQNVSRKVVINWDIWSETGLAVETKVPEHLQQLRQEMLGKGILNNEGIAAFDRILSSNLPRVIVSTQNLDSRIELGKSFSGDSFFQELQKLHGPTSISVSRRALGSGYIAASGDLEQKIAEVWQRILGVDQIGVNDNFFDLGGNSLLGLQLVSELSRELGLQIAPVTLFEFPTISALVRHLKPQSREDNTNKSESNLRARREQLRAKLSTCEIAIIGMAGRFPGARSIEELWSNLCKGIESTTFFTEDELLGAGVPQDQLKNSRYVRAGSIIENIELFDAELFGLSPREADVTDPQHRIFLECAWEVLERAGYDPSVYKGDIGVFAGSNLSTYLLKMYGDPKVRDSINTLQAILGNDKDSLTTMVSYRLNLRGPSVAIQTFCSTSLVAVHTACQSLRSGECDMALAGGIRIVVPDKQGYIYEQGGIAPSDGHTRAFDERANGSVLGNGVGIVCLKRLDDALADGDHIHAVIKGSAINNDGSLKAGYTAPSISGQAYAITAALENAGIKPDSLSYIEAHGSATELGDPIEIAALTKVFREQTEQKTFCPIGSVKSNFGHLDRAAGVTALIKTALSLEHKKIPPSINFENPNPNINFAESPFYVNTHLSDWPKNGDVRRAGVNSLGMGGTNAHVILEEAPPYQSSGTSRSQQLLVLSAKTETALDQLTENLAQFMEGSSDINLADVAYTLKVGRRPLEYRRVLVCQNKEDAIAALQSKDPRRITTALREEKETPIIFMFPGLGGQYLNIGRDLYESEPTFRNEIDRCSEILIPYLDLDLRLEIYSDSQPAESKSSVEEPNTRTVDFRRMLKSKVTEEDDGIITSTSISQSILFVIEYALARLCMEWGIRPDAMIGYSIGEYVAACLSGVFSIEDALKIVSQRARLIESLPPGKLLSVGLSEEKVSEMLGSELSIMAVNGPEQCVISGPQEAIESLQYNLDKVGVVHRLLQAEHAFHSKMMEPIFDSVVSLFDQIQLKAPQIPYVSNVTGTWIRTDEATDPIYWAKHMCCPVLFSKGIQELLAPKNEVFLEVGPSLLSSIVLQNSSVSENHKPTSLSLLRHSYEKSDDLTYILQALGKLWMYGITPDWEGFYKQQQRRRVILPTYPFQRKRYWINANPDRSAINQSISNTSAISDKGWLYFPSWMRTPPISSYLEHCNSNDLKSDGTIRWWILCDKQGIGEQLIPSLEQGGGQVTRIILGKDFSQLGTEFFSVRPGYEEDYLAIINASDGLPNTIIYFSSGGEFEYTPINPTNNGNEQTASCVQTLLRLLCKIDLNNLCRILVVSDQLHEIVGEELTQPEQIKLLGICSTFAKKSPQLQIKNLDLVFNNSSDHQQNLVKQILAESVNHTSEKIIAYRGGHRWVPTTANLNESIKNGRQSIPNGKRNYLVINGLGRIGYEFCQHLALDVKHRLVLIETKSLPSRELWEEWLLSDLEKGAITERIKRLQMLEGIADVHLFENDLSNPDHIFPLFTEIENLIGIPHGIIYIFEPELGGQASKTNASYDGVLDKALLRLKCLSENLQGDELDFRILASQASTEESDAQQDSTWNLFLDSYADMSFRNGGIHWTSVTWDVSNESDRAGNLSGLIEQVLHQGHIPKVMISSKVLTEGWNKLDSIFEHIPLIEVPEPIEAITQYPRPNLRVTYVPPRNQTEQAIAQIWSELLGVKEIGIHDNFLELGGDSLLAVRLISRLRDIFQQDFAVRLIFEASTIAELSDAIHQQNGDQENTYDGEDVERMIEMIEQLSEEDAEQELLKIRQTLE